MDTAAFDIAAGDRLQVLVMLTSTRVVVTQRAARRKSNIDIDQPPDCKRKVLQQQDAPP
jgi:hypothetical protein